MSRKPRVVLVGTAGFGNHYAGTLLDKVDPDSFVFEGIVDPFVKNAPRYQDFVERGIPIYDTLEEFYAEHQAELAMIVTPIRFHKPQSITALTHGSNVLCEKPLMTNINEVQELKDVVERTGRQMAVGFQWSFSPALLQLKQDILDGVFGKPVFFQSLTVFPRYDRYFNRNNWAGKIFDPSGHLVLDCVATNATAHYLHNLFFMLGDSIPGSAMPKKVKASLYRVNPIETFDSCFLSGETEDGVKFQYLTSHSAVEDIQPVLRYAFENAVVTFDSNAPGTKMIATFKDGTVREYESPHANTCGYDQKIHFMIENVEKNLPIPCQIDTVLPHMKVCDALFDLVDIHSFPQEMIYRASNPRRKEGTEDDGNFVRGLYQDMRRCFDEGKLPDELGLRWAQPSTEVDVSAYQRFSGEKFRVK